MRGAAALLGEGERRSKLGAAFLGIASGRGALAASLLKIRIGRRGADTCALVPAQPTQKATAMQVRAKA